nr:MAG TPA: hypothetical protein [Inoviridae sp.]
MLHLHMHLQKFKCFAITYFCITKKGEQSSNFQNRNTGVY